MAEQASEQSIYLHAVELASPSDRAAYLDEVCREKPRLRLELDALLAAHDRLGAEPPPSGPEPPRTMVEPISEHPGTLIGRYKLLEQIGEGGMGTVWVAEQTQPVRRKVALKLIKAGMDSKSVLARFEAERQAHAMMDHPNIAKVLDAGTTESGRPYFAMEFVKGIPITRYCDEARLSVQERLTLFMPVCHAVQHAHQKGIIHRDLKPSNILVCLYDGVPVPKVIDFGLAKAMYQPLTERTLHTAQGLMMGTPLYMSPEQAELNNLDVDTRTDVYSLGVVLYELLTGTTPLECKRLKEAAWHEMLRLIKEEEPPKPSTRISGSGALLRMAAQRKLEPAKLTKLLRGDLDWIVMKALDKERGRRYETANGLARDLRNYLADEPVEATPPSRGYRLRKFALKYRKAIVTATAFLVLLVAGLVASTLLAVWATSAESEANEQRIASHEARADAEANLYVARMNLAQMDWENANVGRILALLAPYRQPPDGKRDPRGWEWYYQDRLCHLELRTLQGHTAPKGGRAVVGSVAFSPDGSRLASASSDRTVKVWDVASGLELLTLKRHTDEVWSVAFSPDSRRLASASWDKTIKIWDLATGNELRTLTGHTDWVRSVTFSPDGRRLASASKDQMIKLWDTVSGQELRALTGHTGQIYSVTFSSDGSRLASASADQTVKVWDAASGELLHTFSGHTDEVKSVAFSPDSSRLASGGADQNIKIWDAASGQELRTLTAHAGQVYSVAFSPDGARLASANQNRTVKVWDMASGLEVLTLQGHTKWVLSVAFNPDGTRLASGSDDQTIKIWDTAGGQEPRTIKGHSSRVWSVVFSADGSRLASASLDNLVKVWDAASGQELCMLKGHAGLVRDIALSPNGSSLASASSDKTIKVWDVASGKVQHTLTGHTDQVYALAFSPDASRLASESGDQTIKVWDTASGRVRHTFKIQAGRGIVAFSLNSSRLAASWSVEIGTIKIWNSASGQELPTLKGQAGRVRRMAFSPDGSRLASACEDGTITVWDTAGARELAALTGHTGPVTSLAFCPDSSRLVSANNEDGTIQVWDTAGGQELRTFKGHTSGVSSLAFSPDGSRLASGSQDGTIKLWDARPWTPELRRQREAFGLVEYHCLKSSSKEQVAERIRADKGITDEVRRDALGLLEVYWPRYAGHQLTE